MTGTESSREVKLYYDTKRSRMGDAFERAARVFLIDNGWSRALSISQLHFLAPPVQYWEELSNAT